MNKDGFISNVRKLVSENKPSEALAALQRLFTDVQDERLLDEVIILNGRYKENERRRHSNTIPIDTYNIESNKISEAILNLSSRINEFERISEKKLESYFRPVKTFPRSYFYQLLTILIFGAIISSILIEREFSDLKRELILIKEMRDTYKSNLDEINVQNGNSRLKPLVISMDSPNNKEREENIYDPRTRRDGRTNSDDIEDALKHLDILFMKEITSQYWDRWEQIKRFNPDLILIHYSCFYPNSSMDESGRFDMFLNRIQNSETQILVYSRQPQFKKDEYIRNWVRQKENEYPGLKRKLHVFIMFPETDLEVQNSQFSSFRHMTTKGDLQGKVKELLKMN